MIYPTTAISKLILAASRHNAPKRRRRCSAGDANSERDTRRLPCGVLPTAVAVVKRRVEYVASNGAASQTAHNFSATSECAVWRSSGGIDNARKKFSVHSINSCGAFGLSDSGASAATTTPLRLTPRVIYVHSERVSHTITLVLLLLPILCILLLLIGVVFVLSYEAAFGRASGIGKALCPSPAFAAFSGGRVVRLSQNFTPILYDLKLQVYLPYKVEMNFGIRNFTVAGQLRLRLHCRRASALIRLHAVNLTVDYDQIRLTTENNNAAVGDAPSIIGALLDTRTTLLDLCMSQPLRAGHNYTLELSYLAVINRPLDGGLFYTSYTAENGEKRLVAATQMQSLDARRLFPSFDQPVFKARFALRVQYPTGLRAISNMPESRAPRHFDDGWSVSEFETTPRMSTYLFALALVDFPYRETAYKNYKIRVWVQPSKLPHVEYALNVAARSLQYFEDYFNISYPLTKLDIVGLPALRVAAMENWGLIFCQQQSILYARGVHSSRNRQYVSDVIAHEIAHMWFGNLVTMEWWDDLWLNEGFATIMAMKAADFAENSTSRTRELFFEHTVKAFRFDQMPNQAHPLSHPADTMYEIKRRFNRITYLKAAAILRMIEGIVGPEIFRLGLRIFLNRFAYSSAKADDLLNTLSETLERNDPNRIQRLPLPSQSSDNETYNKNLSLVKLMHEWIYCTGFPLIKIDNRAAIDSDIGVNTTKMTQELQYYPSEKEGGSGQARSRWRPRQTASRLESVEDHITGYTNRTFALRQLPFLALLDNNRHNVTQVFGITALPARPPRQSIKPTPSHDFRWKVPLFIDSRTANNTKVLWMLAQNNTISLTANEFIDSRSYGYYRLLYHDYTPVIERLRADHRAVDVVSRARLLEDLFTMARIGLVPYDTTFRVCEYLVNETDYLPLLIFNNHAQTLYLQLRRRRTNAEFLKMLRPAYHKLFSGQLKQTYISETLREFLMTQLCYWHYTPCIRDALAHFDRLRRSCRVENLSNATCNSIPPELRAPIYGVGVSFGSLADFAFLEEKYANETYDAERIRMINGFASTRNVSLAVYTLKHFISRFHQRPALKEELIDYLHKLVKSSILGEIRDYIRLNFGDMTQRIPHPQVIRILLTYVTKWMHTDEDLEELEAFGKRFANNLRTHHMTSYFEELKAEVNVNRHFMQRYSYQILDYFTTKSIEFV